MSAKIKRGPSKTGGIGKKRTPSRDAKTGSQRKKAIENQILREGTPAAVATRLADRERSGDIKRKPEEIKIAEEDLIPEEYLDSEVSTEDEDDSLLPDLDEPSTDWEGGGEALTPGASFLGQEIEETENGSYELRVDDDGRCRFDRPNWFADVAMTDKGEEDFERTDFRFQMFDAVAEWLTRYRAQFLKDPVPEGLGVQAYEEMKKGHAAVSPGGFLELSGIKKQIADDLNIQQRSVESDFSRYATSCSLVWDDGSPLPLVFLFGSDARMAWVACAVRQFFAAINVTLNPDTLQGITVPKTKKDKTTLASASLASLTQKEVVARANLMAGTSWAEVMDSYFPKPKKP